MIPNSKPNCSQLIKGGRSSLLKDENQKLVCYELLPSSTVVLLYKNNLSFNYELKSLNLSKAHIIQETNKTKKVEIDWVPDTNWSKMSLASQQTLILIDQRERIVSFFNSKTLKRKYHFLDKSIPKFKSNTHHSEKTRLEPSIFNIGYRDYIPYQDKTIFKLNSIKLRKTIFQIDLDPQCYCLYSLNQNLVLGLQMRKGVDDVQQNMIVYDILKRKSKILLRNRVLFDIFPKCFKFRIRCPKKIELFFLGFMVENSNIAQDYFNIHKEDDFVIKFFIFTKEEGGDLELKGELPHNFSEGSESFYMEFENVTRKVKVKSIWRVKNKIKIQKYYFQLDESFNIDYDFKPETGEIISFKIDWDEKPSIKLLDSESILLINENEYEVLSVKDT